MTQIRLQTPSDWRKPALKATGVNSEPIWALKHNSGMLSLRGSRRLSLGRAAQVGRSASTWVAQVQTHCLRPPKVCTRPPALQIRFGSNKIGSNELVWPLYTSQISSPSYFIPNQTSNPHYKCFCNFHFGFFKYKLRLAFWGRYWWFYCLFAGIWLSWLEKRPGVCFYNVFMAEQLQIYYKMIMTNF